MAKIGAGHADAMLRSGFKEVSQVLPAFPSHGVQPVEDMGLFGNATPQEVMQDKETISQKADRVASSAQDADDDSDGR